MITEFGEITNGIELTKPNVISYAIDKNNYMAFEIEQNQTNIRRLVEFQFHRVNDEIENESDSGHDH